MDERPVAVVRAAGEWLVSQLRGDGFTWAASLLKLERRVGTRREQIHLQGSTWNRTGQLVCFSTVLNVRDRALRQWRRANPGLTMRPSGNDDFLCGSPLGEVAGSWNLGEVDITDPESRVAHLEAYLKVLREDALPWFAASVSPETMRADSDALEWLVCHGRSAEANRLVERWLARNGLARADFDRADFDRGRQAGKLGGRSRIFMGYGFEIGWSSAVLCLDPSRDRVTRDRASRDLASRDRASGLPQ